MCATAPRQTVLVASPAHRTSLSRWFWRDLNRAIGVKPVGTSQSAKASQRFVSAFLAAQRRREEQFVSASPRNH